VTFDDGPDGEWTREYWTYSPNTKRVQRFSCWWKTHAAAELVHRVVAEGHEVACTVRSPKSGGRFAPINPAPARGGSRRAGDDFRCTSQLLSSSLRSPDVGSSW